MREYEMRRKFTEWAGSWEDITNLERRSDGQTF